TVAIVVHLFLGPVQNVLVALFLHVVVQPGSPLHLCPSQSIRIATERKVVQQPLHTRVGTATSQPAVGHARPAYNGITRRRHAPPPLRPEPLPPGPLPSSTGARPPPPHRP